MNTIFHASVISIPKFQRYAKGLSMTYAENVPKLGYYGQRTYDWKDTNWESARYRLKYKTTHAVVLNKYFKILIEMAALIWNREKKFLNKTKVERKRVFKKKKKKTSKRMKTRYINSQLGQTQPVSKLRWKM